MKTQNMSKSLVGLRGMIFIVGIALFGISVMCNFLLYSSFSDDILYKSTYSSMGIAFDITKLCMAFSIGLCFYALRAYIFAAIAASFWVLLTLISIISAFGFMAVVNNAMESAALVSSTVFKSTEAALDDVQTKLNELSQHADSTLAAQAQRQINSLNTQLETFKQGIAKNFAGSNAGSIASRIGDCTGNGYYIRTYCPQISQIESQIVVQKVIVDGHQAYLGALFAKESRLSEMSSLNISNANITSHIHPMFIGLAALFKTSANQMKYYFLIVSSILCELLGSFSLVLFSRLGVLDDYAPYTSNLVSEPAKPVTPVTHSVPEDKSSNDKKVSDEEEIPDHFLKKTTEQALERGDISCNQNDISNYLNATFNVQPEPKVINGWMKEWFVNHPST